MDEIKQRHEQVQGARPLTVMGPGWEDVWAPLGSPPCPGSL